jgi:hypothetical protein
MQDKSQNRGAAMLFRTRVVVDALADEVYLLCFFVYSSLRFPFKISSASYNKNLILKIGIK